MNTRAETVSCYRADKEILRPPKECGHMRKRETMGRQNPSLKQTLLH